MEDCPIVRSLGQIVASGKPFVWLPDQLPFFCQDLDAIQLTFDSTRVHTASRVEDYVPILSETFKTSNTGDIASDADSENVDEDPLPRAQRLQAEARSVRHPMCHMPPKKTIL